MKHTPGPWVVGNNTGLPGFEGVLDSKGNRILTPVPMYATDINDEERETRRANNFLISKSPELLEKLKKITSEAEDMEFEINSEFCGEYREEIREAKLLIEEIERNEQ